MASLMPRWIKCQGWIGSPAPELNGCLLSVGSRQSSGSSLPLVGFVTGVFGVLVGAGGGFILVPILRIFFDKDPAIVAGTVLALVAANSISGAFAYRYMRVVDKRSAYLFAAAAIPGSVIAPFVLKKALEGLPGVFDAMFGLLLVILAVRIATQQFDSGRQSRLGRARSRRRSFINPQTLHRRRITAESGETYRYRLNERWAVLINFVLGFISSFFGVGGGFLRTPILVYAFGFPVQVAVATSIFALSFLHNCGRGHSRLHWQHRVVPHIHIRGDRLSNRRSDRRSTLWQGARSLDNAPPHVRHPRHGRPARHSGDMGLKDSHDKC